MKYSKWCHIQERGALMDGCARQPSMAVYVVKQPLLFSFKRGFPPFFEERRGGMAKSCIMLLTWSGSSQFCS